MLTLHPDDAADITVWTSIEGNAIIIAACIPTLQPLFDQFVTKGVFGSGGNGQGGTGYKSHETPKLELATIGSRSKQTAGQHRRTGISDTILKQDSQESILSPEYGHFGDESQGLGQGDKLQEHHGIMRTQQLTIVYGH